MWKLRQTWSDIIPNKRLYALDIRIQMIDPAWPVTAQPPEEPIASIHVNPKFLIKVTEPAGTRSRHAVFNPTGTSLFSETRGTGSESASLCRCIVVMPRATWPQDFIVLESLSWLEHHSDALALQCCRSCNNKKKITSCVTSFVNCGLCGSLCQTGSQLTWVFKYLFQGENVKKRKINKRRKTGLKREKVSVVRLEKHLMYSFCPVFILKNV